MDALTTPSNWQRVRLGDMTTSFTKQTGFDYSASIKPTLIKEQLPNYIPFIQNKDFLGHYINYKTDYFIPNEIAIRFPQILLNEKCLLISISGAIGNVAVFNHSQNAFIGGAIAVLKFKEKKSLDFVMHFLMSASGQKLLLNSVKSSSHKNLTIADLRDLLIPLPPLNEQIAIANILSDVDHYLYSLDALILKKESVKKALSFELLSQRKRLKGFNQAWQKVRLGDIGKPCMCKRVMKHQTTRYGEIPFYKIGTFGNTADAFISKKLFLEYKTKYSFPKKGDILISASGTIGRAVIYDGKPAYFQDSNIVWIDNDETLVKNDFLFYVYSHVKWNTEHTTILRLYNDNFKNTLIPLPPLNEQIAIANVLSDVDNEIISLKNKKRQFENIKKALNHDLMSAKIRVLKE
ncbi:restriction endonuclease subunit S [Helicobacter pylori]|uniref:restriction endonuclease subunit S n=1 Tax=Helicobacter pylori TaxID=210 RepID=UPI000EB390BC|nr:restriction endonuclease subunit S [Helicobacter pylori]RKV11447.1 restriction endonuclease subunit S [Helicobacter pylori]WQX60740.1 restriction endonuclease subunit S [Helicobacter pylori]